MAGTATGFDWGGARGQKWRNCLAPMEAMLSVVNVPLIQALQVTHPCRIADIGCGGGGTALDLQRRMPDGSAVWGFDISPALVEAARARIGAGDRNITFEVADVALAPAPAMGFDRLVSRFGVMFFANPLVAFSNLARWLGPKGRFAFAVWAPPADNPWMTYVREAVNEVVELTPPNPDAPGPFRYSNVDKLLDLLRQAGFDHLNAVEWRGLLPVGGGLSAADAAKFALASFSIAEPLAEAGATSAECAQRALADRYGQHLRDEIVMMAACVHLVTGCLRT